MRTRGGSRTGRWAVGGLSAAVVAAVTAGVVLGVGSSTPSRRGTAGHRVGAAVAPLAGRSAGHPTTTASPPAATTAPPGPPYSVASDTITLVDTTRPSPPRGAVPGAVQRTLRTVIRKPVGAPGPLPLIVFGHGFDTTPEVYGTLLDTWAAAGYLVAAPDFPGSASDLPGPATESDIPEQAKDLSFVVTALLGGREGPVDPARIAVAGHSDGGSSVVMLAEQPDDVDPRIAAYLVLAGQIPDGVSGPWDAAAAGTLLCMVGTDDQYGNLSLTGTAYASAHMTKAMVTVPGGDHVGIFTGAGAVPEEVRAATVRFLALALGPRRPVTDASLASTLAAPPGAAPYQVVTG